MVDDLCDPHRTVADSNRFRMYIQANRCTDDSVDDGELIAEAPDFVLNEWNPNTPCITNS